MTCDDSSAGAGEGLKGETEEEEGEQIEGQNEGIL